MPNVKALLLHLLSISALFIISSAKKNDHEQINLIPGQSLKQKIRPNVPIQLITTNIPAKYRYAVFQAHSQIYSLILSYDDVIKHGTHIKSKNPGLVKLLKLEETSASIFLRSNASDYVTVYLQVELHTHSDPIPGGCNMEFDVETSPFLQVSYDAFITRIAYQPASLGYRRDEEQKSCDFSYTAMDYDFYVYHMVEGNLKETDYFHAISLMMDVNSMKSNAIKVNPLFAMSRMTFSITTYRRQGIVFNVVAKNKSNSVAYIPGVSYGCSLLPGADSCSDLFKPFEWVLAIVGAMLGLFLCFVGHRFFKTALATFGFITTAMIIYIFLIRWSTISYPGIVAITLLVGVIGGISWTFMWWISGSPLAAILLPGFDLGFLIGCILMFTPFGDLKIFQSDANFWLCIGCCVLLVPVILISFTKLLHILSCSVVGSYAGVFLMDCFFDGSLRYILINVIRRATIPNFNNVINVMPYQISDILLTLSWIILIFISTGFQFLRERGRPPFPVSDYIFRKLLEGQMQQEEQQRSERDTLLLPNSTNDSRGRYQSIVF